MIWLRNLTATPLRVTLAASYMASGPKRVELGTIVLGAKETRQVDIAGLLVRAGLADYSGAANLTFTTAGAGDSLLVATGSTSKDANYVFAVDPIILVPETGKIICTWQVEGDTDTMFSLWNSGNKAEDADLVLFFPGGHYRLHLHLRANESTALDMAELIHSGTPDADGNVIPATATLGSARLTNPEGRKRMDIKIDTGIFNVAAATCWEPCPECDDIEYVIANPDPGATTPGGTIPFHTIATDKYGTQYDVTADTAWSSLNTGIATIASTGVATGVAVGSATIKGHYQDTGVPYWDEGDLCQYPLPQCPVLIGNPTTPMNVAPKVTITAPEGTDIPTIAQGQQTGRNFIDLTATGNPTGGTYLWTITSCPDCVSLSSTTTSATKAIAGMVGSATVQVTYTLNGMMAQASQSLKVQKPSSLGQTLTSSTMSCGSYDTQKLLIAYQVQDGSAPPQSIATPGMFAQETFSLISDTCGQGLPMATSGPTDSGGTFQDTLSLCSSKCLPAGSHRQPLGSCTLKVNQTWSVNGFTTRHNVVTYTCTGPTVTPQ